MKINYYEIFRNKLIEAEETVIQNKSNLEKIFEGSKKISSVLVELLTTEKSLNKEAIEQIRNVVSDIKCISYKPTTFRVVIPNGNFFDMKYNPSPLEIQYPEDYKPMDSFIIDVSGKRYSIGNRSEFEQCLDSINILLSTNPVTKPVEPETPAEEPAPEETPEEAPEEAPEGPPEEKPEEKPKA
jgi:hypothetical protein